MATVQTVGPLASALGPTRPVAVELPPFSGLAAPGLLGVEIGLAGALPAGALRPGSLALPSLRPGLLAHLGATGLPTRLGASSARLGASTAALHPRSGPVRLATLRLTAGLTTL